jgi:hypothetical protein
VARASNSNFAKLPELLREQCLHAAGSSGRANGTLRYIMAPTARVPEDQPMLTILYRCPATGQMTQGWYTDESPEETGVVYAPMNCPACGRVHLVNPATGKLLGDLDLERP